MRAVVVWVLPILLLAGCTEAPESEPEPSQQGPALSGFVFDGALRPLAGVAVEVSAGNASANATATATTDDGGKYVLSGLPRDVPLLVTASLEGYQTLSRTTSVPTGASIVLNLTLQAVPKVEAYHEVQKFDGFIPCQVRTAPDGQGTTTECGSLLAQERNDIWEFSVGSDVAGMVIEVVWEPQTMAATIMNLTVETVGFGDSDQVLATVEGPSVLKAQVSQAAAEQYYSEGGILRVTVSIGSDMDEEAGASAGAAIQQDFQAFASVFYHAPPPPTYSVTG